MSHREILRVVFYYCPFKALHIASCLPFLLELVLDLPADLILTQILGVMKIGLIFQFCDEGSANFHRQQPAIALQLLSSGVSTARHHSYRSSAPLEPPAQTGAALSASSPTVLAPFQIRLDDSQVRAFSCAVTSQRRMAGHPTSPKIDTG